MLKIFLIKGGDDDDESSYSLRLLAKSMLRIWKAGKTKIYLFFQFDNPPVLSAFVLKDFVSLFTFQILVKSSELAQNVCCEGA